MRTAQQGEPGAVETLLARLRPLFLEFFARRVDRDTADDLTQEALLGILKALPRLDPGRASRYVTGLAHHQLQSESRRRARAMRRLAPIEAALDIPSPVSAEQEIEYADLGRVVAQLPPRVRACVLATLRGLSPADIALVDGVSPTTVRRQLQRARSHLRAALGLAAPALHTPRGLDDAPPRYVREAALLLYPNERFPEFGRRRSRGGEVAAQAGARPRRGRGPTPWRRRAHAARA